MKKIVFVFAIVLILITMVIGNPSKPEYIEWANKKIVGTNDGIIGAVGRTIVSPIVSAPTTYDNYYIFTIFKSENIDGSVYKTLGLYRNFFFLAKSQASIISHNNDYINMNENIVDNANSKIDNFIEDASEKLNDFIDNASKTINDSLAATPAQPDVEDNSQFDVGGSIKEGAIYNTYTNGRYGFSIDYPNQFYIGIPPSNGDGLTFLSKDGKSELIAYGSNYVTGESAKALYESEANNIKDIAYKFQKDNWFVLSWVDEGIAYYTRTIVGEGSTNTFRFTCPEEQLDQYYDIIDHISKSFEKGYIDTAN